ncbi:MAG: papain fold toxin domain-containing protein [Methanosarcinaceae archaeon]
MTTLSDQKVFQQLTEIADQYELLECQACAEAICAWLKARNISAIHIKITARHTDFIISKRVGENFSITFNGIHYGTEVRNKVFDNLPDTGMTREDWLNDFESLDGFDIEIYDC